MGIYEIDKQILQYIDDETGEIVDLERFLQLQIEKTKKIENIGLYIKNLESEAKEIKCEENSLQERRRAKENKAKRLRKLLTDVLKGEKFETPKIKLSFRESEYVKIMAEETEIIKWLEKNMDECLIYKNPEINKTAVKQIIKSGETIPGIIIDKNVNLQIK